MYGYMLIFPLRFNATVSATSASTYGVPVGAMGLEETHPLVVGHQRAGWITCPFARTSSRMVGQREDITGTVDNSH